MIFFATFICMESNIPLDVQLEAILFFKGEPMRIKNIAKLLSVKDVDIRSAVQTLREKLTDRGVQIMTKEDEVELRTTSTMSDIIEKFRKEELTKDLGKAGLETLSIILYKGPVTRAEVDYIRGVNSTFIIRNLLIRGLIEKITNPKDKRSFLYKPTFDLLSFMGVQSIDALPEFEIVQQELETFMNKSDTINTENHG